MHNYNDDIDNKARAYASPKHRATTQLTPLWEHIIRTRTLPDHVCPKKIFAEFLERLHDPEWQVRQHALRVLIDVLAVMRQDADAYMLTLIPQLVENLAHAAPTVRKGALDCLRLYLMHTVRVKEVFMQILDIGLHQRATNEPYGGRLTCGVLLSIPALVQTTLQTEDREFILQHSINLLMDKIQLVNQQEIMLKVLNKIRELIGDTGFEQYLNTKQNREFELLNNMYVNNLSDKSSASWQTPRTDWLESDNKQVKVIMETEIKINDDTLTMRLLEADENLSSAAENSIEFMENDVVYGNLAKPRKIYYVMNSYSDSEIEDVNQRRKSEGYLHTPTRTPKRVTFGGEVVKVRTPDSDTAAYVNKMPKSYSFSAPRTPMPNNGLVSVLNTETQHKTSALSVQIPMDNTKPLEQTTAEQQSSPTKSPTISSPKLSGKRLSISSIESNISPKAPHKEIEVLHNLQRDPSPSRVRRLEVLSPSTVFGESYKSNLQNEATQTGSEDVEQNEVKSWEDLNIVADDVVLDLRSGVSQNFQILI